MPAVIELPDLKAGDVVARKYRVQLRLGAGGMGAVYLAENLDIGRKVALKLLHPKHSQNADLLRRFKQEARAAAAIAHPNIVDVLDLGETDDGAAFIVMEYLEGVSLRKRIHGQGMLSIEETTDIVEEILVALAAAHAKQIIHRDLKPDNIFLVSRPRRGVKLLDFGISKLRDDETLDTTETGAIMGTPLYMPPEQARGSRDVGVPADLYSVGAVLYHALAGRPPFVGKNLTEILSQVLQDTPAPLAKYRDDMPAELAELVAALLAKSPAARPQTAVETRARLRAAVGRPAIAEASSEALAETVDVPRPSTGGATVASVVSPVGATALPRRAMAEACPPAEAIDALLAAGLDADAAAKIEAHLDTCSDCRVLVGQLAKDSVYDRSASARPVVTTHAGTAGEIARREPRRRWPLALGAGALAVVAIAGYTINRQRASSATSEPAAAPPDAVVTTSVTEAPPPPPPLVDAAPAPDTGAAALVRRPASPRSPDAGATPADAAVNASPADANEKPDFDDMGMSNSLKKPPDAATP